MPRHTQFGAHKNPAPHSRQHGLCLAAEANSENASVNRALESHEHTVTDFSTNELQAPLHAAPMHAATAGAAPTQDRLLTVHEVADLLQVPVSWVYGRTRKHSLERLPGYRLGKYWRFNREEVLAWVQRHCKDFRAA